MLSAGEMRQCAQAAQVLPQLQPPDADRPDNGIFVDASGLLRIEACKRVASGGTRVVYQHPFNENMLIKVIRPEIVGPNGAVVRRRRRFRIARLRPFGVYVTFHRELRETLRLARRAYPNLNFAFPFPRAHGVIWTTAGLGLVVEKVTSADNSLAPSLDALLKEKRFTEMHWQRLQALFDLCARNHLVIGDANAHNFLYQDIGEGRFVVIDSIGEKSLIPIYEFSSFCNRLKLRHKLRLLKERIERFTHLQLQGG